MTVFMQRRCIEWQSKRLAATFRMCFTLDENYCIRSFNSFLVVMKFYTLPGIGPESLTEQDAWSCYQLILSHIRHIFIQLLTL